MKTFTHPSERGFDRPVQTGRARILDATRCYVGGSSSSKQTTEDNRITATDQGSVVKDSDLSDRSLANSGLIISGRNEGTITIEQTLGEKATQDLSALVGASSGQQTLLASLLGTEQKSAEKLDSYIKIGALILAGGGALWFILRKAK